MIKFLKVFIFSSACLAGIEFTYFSNYAFDSSKPQSEQSVIKNKEIKKTESYSKSEGHRVFYTYELYINPPLFDENRVETNKDFYESTNIGDKIKISYYKGLYGLRYYTKNYELVH